MSFEGHYKRVSLVVVSIDANFVVYQLAFGVVENENQYSWKYFLKKVYEQFGKNGGFGLCFIID